MRVRLFHILLLFLLVGAGCVLYGWLVEPRRLVVREVAVPLAKDLGPLRIAFVSDIHAGGRGVNAKRVQRVVEIIHAGKPDLILIAGDIVNGHDHLDDRSVDNVAELNASLAPLRALSAPLGVFAVAGNHDNWLGVTNADALYEGLGIPRVDNRSRLVDDRACIFGIGDEWTGAPSDVGLLQCPTDVPVIGIMHNPDSAFRLPTGADLLLAGHTHGGQVNLPILGRVATSTNAGTPYAYGLKEVNGTPLFVTAGVGMSILPVRFRAPPEVVFITLG